MRDGTLQLVLRGPVEEGSGSSIDVLFAAPVVFLSLSMFCRSSKPRVFLAQAYYQCQSAAALEIGEG
jgi:hypothetical protein